MIDSFHLNDRIQLGLCTEFSTYLQTLGVIRLTVFDLTGFDSQSGELTLAKLLQYNITLSFLKKESNVCKTSTASNKRTFSSGSGHI